MPSSLTPPRSDLQHLKRALFLMGSDWKFTQKTPANQQTKEQFLQDIWSSKLEVTVTPAIRVFKNWPIKSNEQPFSCPTFNQQYGRTGFLYKENVTEQPVLQFI